MIGLPTLLANVQFGERTIDDHCVPPTSDEIGAGS